jgi:hypothetical protein
MEIKEDIIKTISFYRNITTETATKETFEVTIIYLPATSRKTLLT